MQAERLSSTIYLAIVLLLFYLFYKILNPFLTTIAWAMVLSITFYPLYMAVLKFLKRPWAASLITLLAILVIALGPVYYLLGSLAKEITDIYGTIEQKGLEAVADIQLHPRIQEVILKLSAYNVLQEFNLQEGLVNALKSLGGYFVKHISDVFTNAFVLVFNFIIMCLTIYYFLKDGELLTDYLRKLLPFPEEQKHRLVKRVKETVVAAVYGSLAVGIVQGSLGGIAFLVLGLPSPVFWGAVMAITSLVPLFGTALVWGPAVFILITSGSVAKGIGLLLFGALIISNLDTVLKPLIIGGRTKMHTLLVFFSVLGGIKFLGFLGFILGPLIAALCLSVFDMYTEE